MPAVRLGSVVLALVVSWSCGDGGVESDGGPGEDGGTAKCGSDRDGDRFEACDDCDDGDPEVNPGVNEGFCCSTNIDDGVDNDCDGDVDERPLLTGCECGPDDADGDGYLDDFDCAPDDAAVNPGVPEGEGCAPGRNDDKDNDCDGEVDEVDVPCDADGDGYPEEDDCNDGNFWQNPGVTETCCDCQTGTWEARAVQCNLQDDDCDGDVDESPICDCTKPDADQDGYREGDDCDDANSNASPGVYECCCPQYGGWFCNDTDDDCDGEEDEGEGLRCCEFEQYD
ncbi:MAG: hypothetical protein HYY06_18230 [Deltaproteobacteria bacterium]|nr:hypothetical protein [Deltaproteobacteria bacterium]